MCPVPWSSRSEIWFVLRHYTYDFSSESRPNTVQSRRLRRFVGGCRFVFNRALALQQGPAEASQTLAQCHI
ncbi:MAG: helix-turn-helix domain-containing protein [Gammaproteobacteria bacterium]|nr:helix-turn-helix domain-containing protein [Gammaproteobacteria bacterium]